MSTDQDPLAMSADEMRRVGYATVDALVDLLSEQRSRPVIRSTGPARMRERLGGPAPQQPEGFDSALRSVVDDVLPHRSNLQHPGYLAYIPGSGTWPGALGDLIASAMNLDCGNWMESSGPSQVELQVLDWFRQWIGYPEGAAGVLVSGGSAANLTALACARELRLGPMTNDAVVYCSDQSHSSVARAARSLGFRPEQVRVVPTDDRYRLRLDALAAVVDADRAAGRTPLVVSANAGATNTGAVDPLPELAEFCSGQRIWFHVDAAYGGFAVLTKRGKAQLRGLERADSVTLDPHKWLYQPFECGAVLVREPGALERAFSVSPDYLADTAAQDAEVNFAARGLQLTRGSRALKLWMSLRTFGISAFRDAIDRTLDLALLAEQTVRADDRLELMMDATLGIICFRRRFPDVETEAEAAFRNAALVASVAESGIGMVSSTRLRGRYAIRLCVLNHSTTADDVLRVIDHVASASVGDQQPRMQLDAERFLAHPPQRPRLEVDHLRRHPLMVTLSEPGRRLVARVGKELRLPAGEVVVRRWASDRDFYLVLDGELRVDVDSAEARQLGAGDFFGELAARDWGSGFGYPRLATVTARSTVRLWQLPQESFGRLAASEAGFKEAVDAAARQRLPLS
ncbi:MAG TPA: aminotransferase class I/II-fold pyridoxal phosphate-dependent enzyme [Nocardioidaceae bacterium]|nr:aminotransferase class I/II-fold pyridoxal phosphate-dependent enzyme [Nocardioidaceae bacterium]